MSYYRVYSSDGSFTQKAVQLHDWWLTKLPETQYDDNGNPLVIGVAGFISQKIRGERGVFHSGPILKALDYVELETVDGMFVILKGFINQQRTLENGFSPKVFNEFIFGFPLNWKKFAKKEFATSCPERSAAKFVARGLVFSPHEDGNDSIKGHADFHDSSPSKSQQRDIYTVDMEVQDCEDPILNNKTTTVCNASPYETPQEHIVEAGHEVPCERSPMTSEFEADSSLCGSPIVRKAADSSSALKCLRVSSRRMTRSMTKVDISKTNSPLLNVDITEDTRNKSMSQVGISNQGESKDADASSESQIDTRRYDSKENQTAVLSKDNVLRINSKRKQNDQKAHDTEKKLTFQVGISSQRKSKDADASSESQIDTRRCDSKENETAVLSKKKLTFQVGILSQRKSMDADVSSESHIGIRKCDLRPKRYKSGCSDPFTNTSVGVGSLVNASTEDSNFSSSVIAEIDDAVPLRTNMKACRNKEKDLEGVASKDEIGSKKVLTPSKSRSKLKSASSCRGGPKKQLIISPKTRSRAKKASKEKCGNEYVLSPESFGGKKSRSGRVLLPSLEFWRNQRVVYDEDGEVCGVEERV